MDLFLRSNKAQGVLLINYRDITPGLKRESSQSCRGVFIFCPVKLLRALSIAKVRPERSAPWRQTAGLVIDRNPDLETLGQATAE